MSFLIFYIITLVHYLLDGKYENNGVAMKLLHSLTGADRPATLSYYSIHTLLLSPEVLAPCGLLLLLSFLLLEHPQCDGPVPVEWPPEDTQEL